jgi:hypothetical protein
MSWIQLEKTKNGAMIWRPLSIKWALKWQSFGFPIMKNSSEFTGWSILVFQYLYYPMVQRIFYSSHSSWIIVMLFTRSGVVIVKRDHSFNASESKVLLFSINGTVPYIKIMQPGILLCIMSHIKRSDLTKHVYSIFS